LAVAHLAKKSSNGTTELDQAICVDSCREALIDQQIYLIGKYGPILFLKEPSLFSSFLCNDEQLGTTISSFHQCFQKRLLENKDFLSVFLPIFLGAVNGKSFKVCIYFFFF
jgi:hypothetical protein